MKPQRDAPSCREPSTLEYAADSSWYPSSTGARSRFSTSRHERTTHREHLDIEHLTRLFPGEILAHVHVVDGIQHPLQNAITPRDSLDESLILFSERLDLSPLLLYLRLDILQIATSSYGSHAYFMTSGREQSYPFFARFRHEYDGTNSDI